MFRNFRDCKGDNAKAAMDVPAMGADTYLGVVCPPVYECPEERVCHRYICHEVPHVC